MWNHEAITWIGSVRETKLHSVEMLCKVKHCYVCNYL